MEIYTIDGGMLSANSYLIVAKEGAKGVLIDAGCSISSLNKEIEKHTSGLSAVLLTHGHFDHITVLEKIKAQYNPKIYIQKNDAQMLKDPHENMSDRFMRKVMILDEADVLLEDGDNVSIEGLDIKVIHTPGHSMGSSLFLVEGYCFSGDTLFKGSIGRYDFPHSDFESLIASLIKIKETLPNDTVIYPGHGRKTTMEKELSTNPHLQF